MLHAMSDLKHARYKKISFAAIHPD